MRLAALIAAAWLAVPAIAIAQEDIRVDGAQPACVSKITKAAYDGPTDRYAHGVLGDAIEYGRLIVSVRGNGRCAWSSGTVHVTLPEHRVFEDIAPRLADLDGDGVAEIITVESSVKLGARLTVWGIRDEAFTRLATTPFIGQPNRWLAPLGAADLDGDGRVELAYIDRPHLAKTLRVWRFDAGRLLLVADKPGLTNHRIGEDFISGGIRDCGDGPEIVTVNGDWSQVMATTLQSGRLQSRDIGKFKSAQSLRSALACKG